MKGFTTTSTLPHDVEQKIEFVKPLEGGPRFALLPKFGGEVDFSTISMERAESLVKNGFKHLRYKSVPKQKPVPAAPADNPKEVL